MANRYRILIVDDSEYNRSLLADILSDEYEILEAADGLEAVSVINKRHEEIQLVLLDIVMPEMDGFQVLTVLNAGGLLEELPVIMISAETSSSYIDYAYDLGAIEYVSRPFDEKTVRRRIKNTIMLYAKQKLLEGMVTEQLLEKEKSNLLMVEILSNIVEFRNGESGLHVLHIRTITELLLKRLVRITDRYRLTPTKIALIINAASLHDIGKISVPEQILNKPGKLTPAEFEIMKTHSAVGAQILNAAPFHRREELVQAAEEICRWHHERYDGRGYPDGLSGEDIPISAQVVALADVYDALISKRVYKEAFSHAQAMRMILDGECGAFNPILLQCLKDVGPKIERELKLHSLGGISKSEIQHMASELLQSGSVSNRTLALLEQERTKYQFFASMSKEIQFEYSYRTDLLTMSEWGAKQLGIGEIIACPEKSAELAAVFAPEDYRDFQKRLRAVTPENPIVDLGYYLTVAGERRWYKAVARPLWIDGEGGEVTGIIGKFTEMHEEHERLNRFIALSEQDSLTKLYNHAAAKTAAEKELAGSNGKRFALLLFDVDGFKQANDNYGHLFGDKVLRYIGRRVQKNIRAGDVASRVGGDEFMVFFSYEEDAEPIVRRIFACVGKQYEAFPVTVSLGAALFPKDGATYEELFHKADQALYWAKKNGKGRYAFYDAGMKELLSVLSPMDH